MVFIIGCQSMFYPPPLINLLEEPAVLFVQVGFFYLICINKMQIGALMQLNLSMFF